MVQEQIKHMYDYPPYTKGRRARTVAVYEEVYKFKRLKKEVRGEEFSLEWKVLVRSIQSSANLDNSEMCLFLDLTRNTTTKKIRRYLLENGSKMVRRGKRTYIRKPRES